MQISRWTLLACVTASFLAPNILTAQDTDAQIKARQALDQKMKELEAPQVVPQKPAAPPAPPPAAKPKEPAPVAPAVAPAAAPTAAKPVPPPPPKTSAPAAGTVIVEPTGATYIPMPAPAPSSAKASGKFMDFQLTPSDPVADQKAQDALRAKMAALRPLPSLPPSTPHKQIASTLPPLPVPPPAIPPSKEARLLDLLQQYKMDVLSPEQYHAQRAKILAEP